MRHTYKITGSDAVRLAERDRLTPYANPDRGREIRVTVGEARGIVRDDPSLVYIIVHKDGWWNGSQRVSEMPGYSAHDYFNAAGMYLGPDDDGVEPTWNDA